MISFYALTFAALIFCFNLRLSSSNNFILCYLSAKSIDKLSLSFINFYKIYPHYFPNVHLAFNCIFYSLIVSILYFNLFFCSSNNDIP